MTALEYRSQVARILEHVSLLEDAVLTRFIANLRQCRGIAFDLDLDVASEIEEHIELLSEEADARGLAY